jgi:hypothetical protein
MSLANRLAGALPSRQTKQLREYRVLLMGADVMALYKCCSEAFKSASHSKQAQRYAHAHAHAHAVNTSNKQGLRANNDDFQTFRHQRQLLYRLARQKGIHL